MTEEKYLKWYCKCGAENTIKLPCALPKSMTCTKCKEEYMMFQHIVKYINTKGELIEITRDLTQI